MHQAYNADLPRDKAVYLRWRGQGGTGIPPKTNKAIYLGSQRSTQRAQVYKRVYTPAHTGTYAHRRTRTRTCTHVTHPHTRARTRESLVVDMGEPSLLRTQVLMLPRTDLEALFSRTFPAARVEQLDSGGFVVLTIHGSGDTHEQAIENALIEWNDMKRDGEYLEQMLTEIAEDLAQPGMNRERHDSLLELLDLASSSLDGGVLVGVIKPLDVPRLTRQIEDFRRRTTTRLGMAAQNAKDHEAAKRKAGTKVAPFKNNMTIAELRALQKEKHGPKR